MILWFEAFFGKQFSRTALPVYLRWGFQLVLSEMDKFFWPLQVFNWNEVYLPYSNFSYLYFFFPTWGTLTTGWKLIRSISLNEEVVDCFFRITVAVCQELFLYIYIQSFSHSLWPSVLREFCSLLERMKIDEILLALSGRPYHLPFFGETQPSCIHSRSIQTSNSPSIHFGLEL